MILKSYSTCGVGDESLRIAFETQQNAFLWVAVLDREPF
ncbi:hypothetical protein LEP1GSC096_4539 [Leptospira interrogans serovar Hebdomadis str. R499]|nr:hypothetical protein LEP1GSC096_4539 [Leptospira interrogans serovar Hebdomadis str. R499]